MTHKLRALGRSSRLEVLVNADNAREFDVRSSELQYRHFFKAVANGSKASVDMRMRR